MSGQLAAPLDRAREELRAARTLLDSGFPSQAIPRAYYAGLQAATATLAVLGERPTTDAGVIAAFSRRVVGGGGVDHEASRTLRSLFEDRNDVDYALVDAPADEARRAIAAAERLVETGTRWVEHRANGA